MHLPGGMFQDLGASSVLVKKITAVKHLPEGTVNGKYIFEQAKQGDEACIKAIDEMVDVLGMGIANICYVVNPQTVVLGGGIMAQKEYLETRIKNSVKRYLIETIWENTKVEFAVNQNHAGMLGAYFNFTSRRMQ